MVSLRHFTEKDADVIQRKCYPQLSTDEILNLISEWDTLDHQGRYFEMFAIENDGNIVGEISLYEHTASIASIGIIMYENERRKGYAAEAVSLLERHAEEKGFRVIQSQIAADNEASRKLFDKLGYENDGYIYRNRKDREVVLYLKVL